MNSLINAYLLASIVLLHFTSLISISLAGSCREAQLCCNGRDSSCVVQRTTISSNIGNTHDAKPCYCDHACLKLNDCCSDFKDYCGVQDCEVSDWGLWSKCSSNCGIGVMLRSRTIEQIPQNGGKHCPTLVQKQECYGYECHTTTNGKVLKEIAILLPSKLSKNNSNTEEHFHKHYQSSFKHKSKYCIEYEVMKSSKGCHKLPNYDVLIEGDRIIVTCDMKVATDNSHNINLSNIKVNNSDSNTPIDNNQHQYDNSPENRYQVKNKNTFYESRETEEENMLIPSKKLNINQSVAKLPSLSISKYRCQGEGLPGRVTRWNSLVSPSCHGKWLRLTVGQSKRCSNTQFDFV